VITRRNGLASLFDNPGICSPAVIQAYLHDARLRRYSLRSTVTSGNNDSGPVRRAIAAPELNRLKALTRQP
jgi:hypothetical protein